MTMLQSPVNVSRWLPLPLEQVVLGDRMRPLSLRHVERLKASFEQLGGQLQLQPILLDREMVLIDGAHRLEAARQLGWSRISAFVLDGDVAKQRALLEIEANLVRRDLGPAELERVWSEHYEPDIRAKARERRAAGLRQGTRLPVISNTNNGEARCEKAAIAEALSVAQSAKAITGLSLGTLNKILEIRKLAEDVSISQRVRDIAVDGLRKLSEPGAKVATVHQRLRRAIQAEQQASEPSAHLEARRTEDRLHRLLNDCAMLAEQLGGEFGDELGALARSCESNRHLIRALRNNLARSLALLVAIECRLEARPISALKLYGSEVAQLLSRTSREHLSIEDSVAQRGT